MISALAHLPWADIIPAAISAVATVLVKDHVIPPVWDSVVEAIAHRAVRNDDVVR